MGMGGQRHDSADLPPGKTRYPLYRRLGGLHGRSGQVWKIFPPRGLDSQTVHSVSSLYTAWATPVRLRYCATSRKVAGSIFGVVIGVFHWHKPSGSIMTLGLAQPPTWMSTRDNSWGVKLAGAWCWQLYILHVPIVLKSGSLGLLEP
jgi:hypothetical protein